MTFFLWNPVTGRWVHPPQGTRWCSDTRNGRSLAHPTPRRARHAGRWGIRSMP